MKAGKTLQELAMELDRQQAVKKDMLVDMGALSMDTGDAGLALQVSGGSMATQYNINDIAHRQIGQTLKIPALYYDRMRMEYPELLAQNVNGWFARTPDMKRMLRTMDGTARALLSDRYRRIDNFEVASAVLPIISGMDGASVESCELTDSRMYLKIVNPRVTAEVKKGDIVQAGIIISNSEGTQESRDWNLATAVDLDVDTTTSSRLKLEPSTTTRDHLGAVVVLTINIISCEEHACRTHQLRYYDTLCTVNNKGGTICHPWIVTKVNILFFNLTSYFIGQLNLHMQGCRIS